MSETTREIPTHAPRAAWRGLALAAVMTGWVTMPAGAELPGRLVPYRALAWSDFQGAPLPHDSEAALVETGLWLGPVVIEIAPRLDGTLAARVEASEIAAFMDPEVSAVRLGSEDAFTLGHAQLHFDIADVFAHRLRARFGELEVHGGSAEKLEAELLELLALETDAILADLAQTQARYDLETRHGRLELRDLSWRAEIGEEVDWWRQRDLLLAADLDPAPPSPPPGSTDHLD